MRIWLAIIILCSTCFLYSQDKPEWLNRFLCGEAIADIQQYYVGIGFGTSRELAEQDARKSFAHCVETRVSSMLREKQQEDNDEVSSYFESSTELQTDISLRGIQISATYFDVENGQYYSIIQISKDDYAAILTQEIDCEIAIQRKKNEALKEQNHINEAKQREVLRAQQEQIQIEMEKQRVKEEQFKLIYQQYSDFLDEDTPSSLFNADCGLPSNHQSLKGSLQLDPYHVLYASYTMRIAILSLQYRADFVHEKIVRNEAQARFQLVPYIGQIHKFTLNAGVTFYDYKREGIQWDSLEVEYTPLVAGSIAFPDCYYTYLSFYCDKRFLEIAPRFYPFYESIGKGVGFTIEAKYLFDKTYREITNGKFFVQPGILFDASRDFSASISYQDNDKFVFSIDIGF